MFKVNIKDMKATLMTSFWCIYCELCSDFKPFSSVSIINFEQVNVCWAVTLNGYWDCTVPSSLAVNTTTLFKSDGLKARTFCCTVRTSALFADHSIWFSFCLFVNWVQISQAFTLSLWGCSVVISVPLWVQTFTWPSDDTEVTHPYYN